MELVSDLICASTVSRGIVAGWCREYARVRRVASIWKQGELIFVRGLGGSNQETVIHVRRVDAPDLDEELEAVREMA